MEHKSFAFLAATQLVGFLRAPHPSLAPQARLAVAGVAWDGAVTNRPGARFGPEAIRRASHMLCEATHPLWDVAPAPGELADYGDLNLPNMSLAAMQEVLQAQAKALIARHPMLWLGGDHSITLPLLRAYREQVGEPLAVVHFDAHCDTWTDHFGEPSGHGTWAYEAIREGLIDPRAMTQIGIRSPAERQFREYVQEQGGRIFAARAMRGRESPEQLTEVIAHVRTVCVKRPVYLTLDIDCLDPAFAPGTGTPEPGGLSTNQILSLLESWDDLAWVGMDVCEVAPPYDHAELTSHAAAVFAWTYLCVRLKQVQSGQSRLVKPSS